MILPKGMFSLYSFDSAGGLYVVQFKKKRYTRYFDSKVRVRSEALFHFWRKLGAM